MSSLAVIQSLQHPLSRLLADDPVRADIEWEFRVGSHSEVFVRQLDINQPGAVVCCAYRDCIPVDVWQLRQQPHIEPTVAVFYTIWSYQRGQGSLLIRQAMEWIQQHRTNISQFVTLSPQTDMARQFHLGNGAWVYRQNLNSVNYQYA